MFTKQTEKSFNRRQHKLMLAFNLVRRRVLRVSDSAQEMQSVIDSLAVPVVQFYLVPGSTGDLKAYCANYGKVPSRKKIIFGYKLHLLINVGGHIWDFELVRTNATDMEISFEKFSEYTALDVLGDKDYTSMLKLSLNSGARTECA